MLAAKTSKFSIIKRISNFILAVLVVVICVNLWLMHTKNTYDWYSLESEQLGRSLASQAARMLATPLSNQDLSSIDNYVNTIETDSFVKGTSLFDQHGKVIQSFDEQYSVIKQFRVLNEPPLIFVEDIVHDGKTIGYVKLLLDRDSIIAHHKSYTQTQLTQTILVMILTALCAIILTRLFYKVKANYRSQEDENTLE